MAETYRAIVLRASSAAAQAGGPVGRDLTVERVTGLTGIEI
jgi:hypothetical protein